MRKSYKRDLEGRRFRKDGLGENGKGEGRSDVSGANVKLTEAGVGSEVKGMAF